MCTFLAYVRGAHAAGAAATRWSVSPTDMAHRVLAELPSVFNKLHAAKKAQGLSFEKISQSIGRDELYTAAMYVQPQQHHS